MTNSFSKIATKVGAASTIAYVSAFGMVSSVFAQKVSNEAPAVTGVDTNVKLGKGIAPDIGTLITSVLTFVMLIAALLILMYLI
ncbi:MAG: hypothetical protein GW947_03490, partial [Candidatus Pacebacteria bacterium]|nr:hypothetical protein [Candidatus Paceibacterota bacterium]